MLLGAGQGWLAGAARGPEPASAAPRVRGDAPRLKVGRVGPWGGVLMKMWRHFQPGAVRLVDGHLRHALRAIERCLVIVCAQRVGGARTASVA